MVTIQQSADSAKDYVALADVVRLLPLIADGRQRHNLGSGRNTSHSQVGYWLERQGLTAFAVPTAARHIPALVIERLGAEFELPGDAFLQTGL